MLHADGFSDMLNTKLHLGTYVMVGCLFKVDVGSLNHLVSQPAGDKIRHFSNSVSS